MEEHKKRILFLSLISLLAIGLLISIVARPKEAIAEMFIDYINSFLS